MTRLLSAWANRASAPVNMLHDGDSVTERTGAGSFEAGYVTKLLRSLQADAGIAGGPGFVNSGSYVPADNSLSSFYSPVGSIGGGAFLGQRGGQWSAGQAVTVTWTGTSLGLHYFQGFTGAAPFTVATDGGAPATVTVPTTGGQNNRGVWQSPTYAAGAHTTVITPTAGQPLYLRGVHINNGDENRGVHGWEAGHWGSKAGDHAADLPGYYADACAVLQPALVTLFIGLNDYSAGTTPSAYGASVTAIVNAVNGYCTTPPSWVICSPYQRADVTSPAYPLAQYRAALAAVVAADPGERRLVDLATVTGLVLPDGVHPDTASHAKIAAAIRPAVLDLAGVSGTLTAQRWTGSAWQQLTPMRWDGATWGELSIRLG